MLRELKVVYEASMERNDRCLCQPCDVLGKDIGMFKDAAPVNVHVNLPGDESSFADRLEAQRKGRADGKTQLH